MEKNKQTNNESKSEDDANAFHINKNGFPIDESTWDKMWKIASKVYPDAQKEMEEIKNSETLADVPVLGIPVLTPQMTVTQCIRSLQDYICSLSYNHTGTQLFEIKKSRPLAGLMDKAKEIVKEALPIKCLEAVILAIYLTNSLSNVERFPIGFKSVFNGHRYYHVVLGIYYNGYFGALGMSRRDDLMDKPLKFKTLFDLISNYQSAYARYTHELKKVRLGGLVTHDPYSQEKILWSVLIMNLAKTSVIDQQHMIDQYSRGIRSHLSYSVPLSALPKKESRQFSRTLHREYTLPVKSSTSKAALKSIANPTKSARCSSSADATYHIKV